MHKDISVVYL